MPDYRRSLIDGGTFFFTVVTQNRLPILTTKEARIFLRGAWLAVQKRYPFTTDAICLLPEHIHCIWTLPIGDSNYSRRWSMIKRLFSQAYINNMNPNGLNEHHFRKQNESHFKRKEFEIWQRRFWEHTILNQADLENHLNYIHFNPVKHGLVKNVIDWPWSSFHRYIKMGFYEQNWGGNEIMGVIENINFGE